MITWSESKVRTRILVVVAILTIAVALAGAYFYTKLLAASNGSGERYLTFRDGTETKVFLVDSHVTYGVFEQNVTIFIKGRSANAGDPAVIVQGKVRNDYEKEYYFAITGDLYTSKGEKLAGTDYIFDLPVGEFTEVQVPAHSVETFELHFKYEGQDIERCDLFLYMEPQETPAP